MNHLNILRQKTVEAKAGDGVRVTTAKLHEPVMP
jgi:hypothetical protein